MPLEAGFGIDFTMLVSPSSEWTSMYTYYNHGLEPPHGGVKSDETGADLKMNIGWFDRVMGWTDDFIGFIGGMCDCPDKHDPDLPLEYKLEIDGNGVGDVILNITMETLDAEFIWEKSTGLIIFKARDAFDLSWAGFLFYMKALKDFSSKIKEQ